MWTRESLPGEGLLPTGSEGAVLEVDPTAPSGLRGVLSLANTLTTTSREALIKLLSCVPLEFLTPAPLCELSDSLRHLFPQQVSVFQPRMSWADEQSMCSAQ